MTLQDRVPEGTPEVVTFPVETNGSRLPRTSPKEGGRLSEGSSRTGQGRTTRVLEPKKDYVLKVEFVVEETLRKVLVEYFSPGRDRTVTQT